MVVFVLSLHFLILLSLLLYFCAALCFFFEETKCLQYALNNNRLFSKCNKYMLVLNKKGHIVINCFKYRTRCPVVFHTFFKINTCLFKMTFELFILILYLIQVPLLSFIHVFSRLLLIPVKGHSYFVFLLNNSVFTPMYYTRRWHGSFRILHL